MSCKLSKLEEKFVELYHEMPIKSTKNDCICDELGLSQTRAHEIKDKLIENNQLQHKKNIRSLSKKEMKFIDKNKDDMPMSVMAEKLDKPYYRVKKYIGGYKRKKYKKKIATNGKLKKSTIESLEDDKKEMNRMINKRKNTQYDVDLDKVDGKVLKEYKRFVLVEKSGYKECIHKSELM